MDSIKSLMERKEFDLVISATENTEDPTSLFYRCAAFMGLNKVDEAIKVLTDNRRLLQEDDLGLLVKTHTDLLCLQGNFDEARKELEYYENLPYVSQQVEESLRDTKKRIRELEIDMLRGAGRKSVEPVEIERRLNSKKPLLVLNGLQLIQPLDVRPFLPKIKQILVEHPSQSVRSFALFVLVDKKHDEVLKFKHLEQIIEVNPAKLEKPFVDAKFLNFVNTIQTNFKNPTLSQNAINLYSTFIIYQYPEKFEFDEKALLCALYKLATNYLSSDSDLSLEDKCKLEGADLNEAQKILDIVAPSIEIF